MFNYFKWIGVALVSLFTFCELPIVFSEAAAQAQTSTATPTTKKNSSLVARNHSGGRMKVVYEETKDPFSAVLIEQYKQSKLFEKIGDLVTSEINLPQDITVLLTDCGEGNAAYIREHRTIVICNELTKENYQLLLKNSDGEEAALKAAIFASVFFFYHETAHMLIDRLNLPVVGKEEDIADQFSGFFLLSNDSSSDKTISGEMILSAARLFALESTTPSNREYQDEHGLNQQRFYNLVCLLYGANPAKYGDLVSKLDYSESRLSRCQSEVGPIMSAWQRLLQPYLKP
jgi:Putative metallopeptidase